jgi:hypothetical protein
MPRRFVLQVLETAEKRLQGRTRGLLVALAAITAAAVAVILLTNGPASGAARRVCANTGPISKLTAFSKLTGRDVDCALVFNDAATNWQQWERPWFLYHVNPDLNYANWQRADPKHRRLVITQNLFPSQLNGADWRDAGASGAYAVHARNLAHNLVAAGQGNAIIRLAHEANGTWYPDSIGNTPREFALWREFWRRTVKAMRSVPGADFQFDWCVNAGVRPIPLRSYYPGDDVVDIIGVDAYDAGVPGPAGSRRWQELYHRPGGIGAVVDFAKARHKLLSIPEWGVGPIGGSAKGAGDDPDYVKGIATVVRENRVAYESYFFNDVWATQLAASPKSLAVYRKYFGR